jgi:uncharacterized tellurite resistance protein B-like protein
LIVMAEPFLSKLLGLPARPETPAEDLALAALLVRVARADGSYDEAEARRIDQALMARHQLGPFEAAKLRAEAEHLESVAPDTVRFTRALKDSVKLEDRIALIEALWSVALADGARDVHEEQLIRLVASLLAVSDQDSARARQKAAVR